MAQCGRSFEIRSELSRTISADWNQCVRVVRIDNLVAFADNRDLDAGDAFSINLENGLSMLRRVENDLVLRALDPGFSAVGNGTQQQESRTSKMCTIVNAPDRVQEKLGHFF